VTLTKLEDLVDAVCGSGLTCNHLACFGAQFHHVRWVEQLVIPTVAGTRPRQTPIHTLAELGPFNFVDVGLHIRVQSVIVQDVIPDFVFKASFIGCNLIFVIKPG